VLEAEQCARTMERKGQHQTRALTARPPMKPGDTVVVFCVDGFITIGVMGDPSDRKFAVGVNETGEPRGPHIVEVDGSRVTPETWRAFVDLFYAVRRSAEVGR
jgi:hypothetical protein